jgi:hypothetical protein
VWQKIAAAPLETTPDLVAGALAQGNISGAMRLLQNEKGRGSFNLGDTSLPTYL